jgi:hypothetical protein
MEHNQLRSKTQEDANIMAHHYDCAQKLRKTQTSWHITTIALKNSGRRKHHGTSLRLRLRTHEHLKLMANSHWIFCGYPLLSFLIHIKFFVTFHWWLFSFPSNFLIYKFLLIRIHIDIALSINCCIYVFTSISPCLSTVVCTHPHRYRLVYQLLYVRIHVDIALSINCRMYAFT